MTQLGGARVLAIAALVAIACDPAPGRRTDPPRAPTAATAIDPTPIGVGSVARVRIRVEMPSGTRVTGVDAPARVSGGEVLGGDEIASASLDGEVYEIVYRLRALRAGSLEWPATAISLVDPSGRAVSLEAPGVTAEIRSILGEFPARTAPFGARAAPPPGPPRRFGPIAAVLICIGLAAVGLVIRRRRSAGAPAPREPVPPWVRARAALAQARGFASRDATTAADAAAVALRSYMIGRFGAVAAAATTEELAATTPPFSAISRWPDFVGLMRDLDALRFPRADRAFQARHREAVETLLARAEGFIDASLPPEPLR